MCDVGVCLFAKVALCSGESCVSGSRARCGSYGGASLMGECGTNMCGINICSVQYNPTFLPYKDVMDPSWGCKKRDGEGKGRREGKEDQLGFGALIA